VVEPGGNPVLYVRDGCHLCDQFLIDLELDLGASIGRLTIVDVDGDAGLAAEYGLRVPVLALAGRVVCEGIYDRPRVRHALRV
jgi:hypothetical protein